VEVPEVQALLPRFRSAHTQVLGVSVDSVYCHANWAKDLGGVSFPLLADFHPKGEMARSYGLYLDGAGITDRATVLIDAAGVVCQAESVTPAGQRDIAALAAECERLDEEYSGPVEDFGEPAGLPEGGLLYVKSRCGFSRTALLARDNLHLSGQLTVRNVSEDAASREALVRAAGSEQAPCLVIGGETIQESADIVTRLLEATAPV
jgi:glutaredoxin-related protein